MPPVNNSDNTGSDGYQFHELRQATSHNEGKNRNRDTPGLSGTKETGLALRGQAVLLVPWYAEENCDTDGQVRVVSCPELFVIGQIDRSDVRRERGLPLASGRSFWMGSSGLGASAGGMFGRLAVAATGRVVVGTSHAWVKKSISSSRVSRISSRAGGWLCDDEARMASKLTLMSATLDSPCEYPAASMSHKFPMYAGRWSAARMTDWYVANRVLLRPSGSDVSAPPQRIYFQASAPCRLQQDVVERGGRRAARICSRPGPVSECC